MSDATIEVEIALLQRHPHLPDPNDVLRCFAEYHEQSQARQRSHDELMESDSNLELEDFGALAASALGTQPAQKSVLGDDPFYGNAEDVDLGDTLPDHRAVPADEDAVAAAASESHDGESEVTDMTTNSSEDENTQEFESLGEDSDVEDSRGDHAPSSEAIADEMSDHDVSAAADKPESEEKKSSPKKRTRKRKKKS